MNKESNISYLCWKLTVVKTSDTPFNSNIIYVIHEKDEKKYSNNLSYVKFEILKFIKYLKLYYSNDIKIIEKTILTPLWNDFYAKFKDQFANVSYGYSITCHKGQGSNFYNVFADVDDILKNIVDDESKKCLYTAVSRTSNDLFLLS